MDTILSSSTLPPRTWNQVAEYYRAQFLNGYCRAQVVKGNDGNDFSPMLHLIEKIAVSPYALGIYGSASLFTRRDAMFTLWISQQPEIDCYPVGMLSVDFIKNRLIFTYDKWVKECDRNDGFSTFEHVMRRLKWFLDLT